MDIVKRLDIMLHEASGTSGSTEMGFNGWWQRSRRMMVSKSVGISQAGVVQLSNHPDYPIGSTMNDIDIVNVKRQGYIITAI